MGTRTTSFGAGRREAHDSSAFYDRFVAPTVASDDDVAGPASALDALHAIGDRCVLGDARDLSALPDSSVALVVTSPPYFVGKEYEQALGEGHVPATYLEFLQLLRDVFLECVRVLEPGGRIAVNVANLGRKPYRSLSADVIAILQDDLGLLLRGEVVWVKGEGASGSCAWGSFRSPSNPVLRDVTERIVIASKGRFDRAKRVVDRREQGLPHQATATNDEFLDATIDLWRIPSESARRVGHPAPFPVELPERLIQLYTYAGDVVLDPFMGAGSTLVAAARTGRVGVGYDVDESYVALARHRLESDEARPVPVPEGAAGKPIGALAEQAAVDAGFVVRGRRVRVPGAVVDLIVEDALGGEWAIEVTGGFTVVPSGAGRLDGAWRAIGRAAVIARTGRRVLVLASHVPSRGTDADAALRRAGPEVVFDVIGLGDPAGLARLARYATGVA